MSLNSTLTESVYVFGQAISECLPGRKHDGAPIDKDKWFKQAVLRATSFRDSSGKYVNKTLQESLVVLRLNDEDAHSLCYKRERESLALLRPDKKSGPSR